MSLALPVSNADVLYRSPEFLEPAILSVLHRATARAALACAYARGRKNGKFADQLAVDGMGEVLERELMVGAEVVIGEGELDKAPMFHIKQRLGPDKDKPPRLLIAVDPLEGTKLNSNFSYGAICVIAAALVGEGRLWGGIDGYMEKFIAGKKVAEGLRKLRSSNGSRNPLANRFGSGSFVLDQSVEDIVQMVSYFTEKQPCFLVAELLDRDRNQDIINRLRRMHVQVRLISDGDVTSAWRVVSHRPEVDFYMGVGAAPEGVISAAMANVARGYAEGRCWFHDTLEGRTQRQRLHEMGIDTQKVYMLDELAGGHVMIAFTPVTDSMLPGIRYEEGGTAISNSIFGRSRTGTFYELKGHHQMPPAPPSEWPATDD